MLKNMIKFKMASGCSDLAPAKAHPDDAAYDLKARTDVELAVGKSTLVPTGLFLELPVGFEAQVRPRSGLALKYGISLPNAPGTIDADYRGEIRVILVNLGREPFSVHAGDRIAQMVVAPVTRIGWQPSETLSETSRQNGGFGSTGTR